MDLPCGKVFDRKQSLAKLKFAQSHGGLPAKKFHVGKIMLVGEAMDVGAISRLQPVLMTASITALELIRCSSRLASVRKSKGLWRWS